MRKQNGLYQTQEKADRGFYIVLAICLAVICVSGYVLFFPPGAAEPAVESPVYTPSGTEAGSVTVSVPEIDTPAEPAIQPEPDGPAETADGQTGEPDAETPPPATEETAAEPAESAPAAAPVEPIWVRPVEGAVVSAFSGDELVRDATMGDWRVHAGADYAAAPGTRVYAVSDGTVAAVESDGLYGTCVTLTLADGMEAVYRGLDDGVKVDAGDSVRAGDVIGTVGDGNLAEAALENHLHLELYADGVAVDPEGVLGGVSATSAPVEEPVADTSAPQDGIFVEE